MPEGYLPARGVHSNGAAGSFLRDRASANRLKPACEVPLVLPNANLSTLASAFISLASRERLLTLSEGLVKIRCIEAALDLGWTVQEGAGNSPSGPVADYASGRDGAVLWRRGPRRLALANGSADVAVVEPFEMMLEIKARPDYGTKAQAQFQEMDADVARVAQNRHCAFLFVFDPKIYRSFSGEKRETRGRPAVAPHWFTGTFPPASAVGRPGGYSVTAARDGATVVMAFIEMAETSRIVVAGSRVDATF